MALFHVIAANAEVEPSRPNAAVPRNAGHRRHTDERLAGPIASGWIHPPRPEQLLGRAR